MHSVRLPRGASRAARPGLGHALVLRHPGDRVPIEFPDPTNSFERPNSTWPMPALILCLRAWRASRSRPRPTGPSLAVDRPGSTPLSSHGDSPTVGSDTVHHGRKWSQGNWSASPSAPDGNVIADRQRLATMAGMDSNPDPLIAKLTPSEDLTTYTYLRHLPLSNCGSSSRPDLGPGRFSLPSTTEIGQVTVAGVVTEPLRGWVRLDESADRPRWRVSPTSDIDVTSRWA